MHCNHAQTPQTLCVTTPNPYTPHKPNQDAHHHLTGTNHIWIGAIADGAGSKTLAHQGSYLAVTTALNYITTQQPNPETNLTNLLQKTLNHTRNTLLNHPTPHKIGTTLALAITTPTQWAAACVGDAFIVAQTNNELTTITGPPAGEYANITELLTSETIHPTYAHSPTPPTTIALSTDGLTQTTLTPTGTPSPKFWNPLFRKAHHNTLNLRALANHMATNDLVTDDVTLIVHVPNPTKKLP